MPTIKIVPMPGVLMPGPTGPQGPRGYQGETGLTGAMGPTGPAGSGSDAPSFIPLPDFLTYAEGRGHLPAINSNFGWNSQGLWFGDAAEGDSASYPVFTDFTIPQNSAVTVEFNVDWQDECSDIGVCIYLDGDTPQWAWGTNTSRISAQFDCLIPMIKGLTTDVQEQTNFITDPGMYHIRFIYNPAGGNKVTLELFSGTNTDNLISSIVLNETLDGAYRVGFASDNNGGRTYISDLSIMVDEDAPYTDTLQNGNSGGALDIADFVFTLDGDVSTMSIHNHDMEIRTTRDGDQDSDIGIYSADDIWIESTDTLRLSSTGDNVEIETSNEGSNTWRFEQNGNLTLPSGNAAISSGSNGTIITDSRTVTFYADYQDTSNGLGDTSSVVLPVNEDTQWFSNNAYYTSTITFADATSVQTIAIFDATSQGTAGMIFQWSSGNLTKTFEETFPLVITGNITAPKEHVALVAGPAEWQFDMDGGIHFPYGPSNARTGSGDVLRFALSSDQSIITGVAPTVTNPTAQRLVIAGQDGVDGDGYDGEGGDVYLWAGRGGGTTGGGGDIKIDGGNGAAGGQGGYVKIRGGYSDNADGGFVEINAGNSYTLNGGDVNIAAGSTFNGEGTAGGNVNINAGYSSSSWAGGSINLTTTASGKITLFGDGGEFINDSSNPGNQIATVSQLPTGATGSFVSSDNKTITVTNGIIVSIEEII